MNTTTNRRVFVSGTDTGIGKTLVAGILASCWRARYWKPIQAGTQEATDSETVAGWIGEERIMPEAYRLLAPLSPNQAAAREGITLDPSQLILPEAAGPLVVEGAGGLMVPIAGEFMMIDLIQRLSLPVILVARSGLGTLNHTLLSLAALHARQVPTLGVVLNGIEQTENRNDIERLGAAPVIGYLPPQQRINPDRFPDIYRNWSLDPGAG